jgi:hypothetical protein
MTILRLADNYRVRLPWGYKLILGALGTLALIVFCFFILGLRGTPLLVEETRLGPQGDFFGGHIASFVGCITLAVVVLTGYLQVLNDQRFRTKEHFINGINVISGYDINKPGCEQAMRLLDYYSSVALELQDSELLLILNTVITKEIRKRIEEIEEAGKEEYPNAVAARKEIQRILSEHHKAVKLKRKQGGP